jgi:hypothetical protein
VDVRGRLGPCQKEVDARPDCVCDKPLETLSAVAAVAAFFQVVIARMSYT